MDRSDFDALEGRIRARGQRMWEEAGSPEGQQGRYLEEARILQSMEEVPVPTIDPRESVVEEASLQRNLGEFPTLRDQGDEQTFPDAVPDEDEDIHLSDGDASEQGGVLPDEDLPEQDLPEVSQADADITSDMPEDDADDDLEPDDVVPDDINDDGLPDQLPLS
jgi:hypothetical protein